ncbi:hypothetical protein [Neolewinella antarctica]|uniref:Uncharacterized protein n=1 Tax=Neolewinella antarctica TaxID=442734 RepID=A0ABX0XCR3_9BACT|nr:hypothetical protein [Neolewinella antarctica]NJC26699.1 hypothetical protein [Neolewinella antarctica]
MRPQSEIIAERKRNQVVYAVDDFQESIQNLRIPALAHLIFTGMLFASTLIAAENLGHGVASLVTAAGLLITARFNLPSPKKLAAVSAFYALVLIGEWISFGPPDLLIPQLNMHEWRGLPVFLNHAIPYVYVLLRVVFGVYVVSPWGTRAKMLSQDTGLLAAVLRERSLE